MGALGTSAAVASVPVKSVTASPSVINHSISGCGAGTVLHTPATAGGQLDANAMGVPELAPAFADAAAHHVTWLSSISCTVTDIVAGGSAATPATPSTTDVQPNAAAVAYSDWYSPN